MVIKESGGVRLFPVLEKVFGCVVVERRVPIMPQKRAGHPVATLAVEIAGSKGRASAQGREAGGGTRRGKTLETGRETKEKRGLGGGYIITSNLEGIRKLFTFVRNKIR